MERIQEIGNKGEGKKYKKRPRAGKIRGKVWEKGIKDNEEEKKIT